MKGDMMVIAKDFNSVAGSEDGSQMEGNFYSTGRNGTLSSSGEGPNGN
jgi:hypothetical protein